MHNSYKEVPFTVGEGECGDGQGGTGIWWIYYQYNYVLLAECYTNWFAHKNGQLDEVYTPFSEDQSGFRHAI